MPQVHRRGFRMEVRSVLAMCGTGGCAPKGGCRLIPRYFLITVGCNRIMQVVLSTWNSSRRPPFVSSHLKKKIRRERKGGEAGQRNDRNGEERSSKQR